MTDTPTGGLTVTGATGTASVEAIFFDVVAVNRETNARQMHRMGMTKTAAEKLVAQISEEYGVHEEFYEAAPTVLVSAPATITTDRRCGTCRYWIPIGQDLGQCTWASDHLPSAISAWTISKPTARSDGTKCPMWELKL